MTANHGGPELETPTRRTNTPSASSITGNRIADLVHEDAVRELLAALCRRREAALRLPALPHRRAAGLGGRDPWPSDGAT